MSLSMIALFGISVATLLFGFLAYRAMTFRPDRPDTRIRQL